MDAKHVAQERFGKYAASYTAPWHNAAGPDLELIARLVGDHPLWVALDIATGGGHTALAVAPHVARVVATDITAPMLGAAREFVLSRGAGNIDFALADAEDLPFPACSFDLVTCRIAAHHFPDPARFVLEVLRVLQPGGLFILQDQVTPEEAGTAEWVTRFENRRDPSHQRALSPFNFAGGVRVQPEDLAELRAWLRQAPPAVQDWMHPTDVDTDQAGFSIHHRVFSARKTGLGDLGCGC